jgi:hypothetical protein
MKMMVVLNFHGTFIGNKDTFKVETGRSYLFTACFLLFSILSLCSCKEEIIDFGTLKSDTRIVAYCALHPGDSIHLLLTHTYPVDDNIVELDDISIESAEVYIINKDRKDSIQLLPNKRGGVLYSCSQSVFEVLPGNTYQLKINAGHLLYVEAETQVPTEKSTWKNYTVADSDDPWPNCKLFTGSWINANPENYNIVSHDYKVVSWDEDTVTFKEMIITDYQMELKNHDGLYTYQKDYCPGYKYYKYHPLITVSLLTADVHFYRYMQYYTLQYHNSDTYRPLELFRGIMPEYTNIENGFGIFGSYLADTLILDKIDEIN